jgi:hypothetical protein
MTMYLPNPDIRPTGFEAGEFIDVPAMAEAATSEVRGPIYRREDAVVHLSEQNRLNITRWAEEYISGLVDNHHGDSEDVRSIIRDLHHQSSFNDRGTSV